jgi:hypothetical protein
MSLAMVLELQGLEADSELEEIPESTVSSGC